MRVTLAGKKQPLMRSMTTTLAGSTITGRVTFDGGDPPATRALEILPTPADPDQTPFFGAYGANLRRSTYFHFLVTFRRTA